MGMFDYVNIEINVSAWQPNFPIEDEVLKQMNFQTKDLECLMTHYVIKDSGQLWTTSETWFDHEEPSPGFEPGPTSSKYTLMDGSTLTNPFSGDITFYDTNKEYSWIEFLASFYKADLKSLHCIKLESREE